MSCYNCRRLEAPEVGHGIGCPVGSKLEIMRKIGERVRLGFVALGNGWVVRSSAVPNLPSAATFIQFLMLW